MGKKEVVINEIRFINYTDQPKYCLLTNGSGYPSARFNYPYHSTADNKTVIVREPVEPGK